MYTVLTSQTHTHIHAPYLVCLACLVIGMCCAVLFKQVVLTNQMTTKFSHKGNSSTQLVPALGVLLLTLSTRQPCCHAVYVDIFSA